MAQIRQMMERLAFQLVAQGIPCYLEYPQTPMRFHGDAFFAVISSERLQLHAPIYTTDTVIVPATATLTVHFLQSEQSPHNEIRLQNRVASDLMPALFSLGWQVTAIQAEDIRYDKQIDRLRLPVHITIQALITTCKAQEVADDDI